MNKKSLAHATQVKDIPDVCLHSYMQACLSSPDAVAAV